MNDRVSPTTAPPGDDDLWSELARLPSEPPPRPPATPPPTPPGGPSPAPAPGPPPSQPRPRRRRRSLALRIAVGVLVALVLLAAGGFLYARWQYGRIERVDLTGVLSTDTSGGVNWLIVGSDSRADIDPDRPDAGWFLGEPVDGERSDAMVILHLEDGEASMLSLPRDLWLPIAGTGADGRINSAYASGGPARLVSTVQQSLDVPIHHYTEIDITGFGDVVDAVGGIQVDFAHPAFDPGSGLLVTEAGPQELDGVQALAYVRARNYTEVVDGVEQVDGSGDLGRTVRQQRFLAALFDAVGSTRNPLRLHGVVSAVADDVILDDDTGLGEIVSMARRMSGFDAALLRLPVRGETTSGGASVLLLDGDAESVLAQIR